MGREPSRGDRFDRGPVLRADPIAIAPLVRGDFDALYATASDPLIWEGHPSNTRHERAAFAQYFEVLVTRIGALGVRIDGAFAGASSYYTAPDMPGSISIGYSFLARKYWGGATNFAVKRLMIDHALTHFPEVWFHINLTNIRSQKATMKLGAVFAYEANLDLSGSGHPDDWKIYRLSRDNWDETVRRHLSAA